MVSDDQYKALSEFRYRLTQFLRFSELASRQLGVSAPQYQLMLHVRAAGEPSNATIGELAKRLGTTHQAAVALVKRCEARRLVTKRRSADDERKVEVRLTAGARKLLQRLAERHISALGGIGDVIRISHLTDGTSALVLNDVRGRSKNSGAATATASAGSRRRAAAFGK